MNLTQKIALACKKNCTIKYSSFIWH